MAVIPIGRREFELYALSLPRGPNFEPYVLHSAWRADKVGVGAVLLEPDDQSFRILALRRQIDHRLVVTHDEHGFRTLGGATNSLTSALRPDEPPEALQPGDKRRPRLLDTEGRTTCERFQLLAGSVSHIPALVAVHETYLAMPRPDDNFVSDFQTDNFDSRLWELYLVAAFREQGVHVSQQQPSPDFLLERHSLSCYVEAVTANPSGERAQGFPPPLHPPDDRAERLIGPAAVRFAKTLRSKLQRNYESMSHVKGTPFALALADFHAPSSMVWSATALPCYLYGILPETVDGPDGRRFASAVPVKALLGAQAIPAGLFRDPSIAHLSAVIFSNSATLGKFNRMGFLAGFRPPGLKMVRAGDLFDPSPDALKPIPFELDILSDQYGALWPGGEAWCLELEVFHNPLATSPLEPDLLPGATHWFEQGGEIISSTPWERRVLSSVTNLLPDK